MNVAIHKLALPRLIPWPGTTRRIPLAPLAEAQGARATHDAETHFAARGAPCKGSGFALEVWVQVLSRASQTRAQELREAFPLELSILWRAWLEVQGEADREADELREWLRKRVNDDSAIHYDGAAAYAAEEGPGAFYGKPVADLTRGQLLYYWSVRAAFGEWFGPGVTKRPTGQWLRSQR